MPDGSAFPSLPLSRQQSKPDDSKLLALIEAAQSMTRTSNRLAKAGGHDSLWTAHIHATRDMSFTLNWKIRAMVPVTEKGTKAKRQFLEEYDGTEWDDPILALCIRHAELLNAYDNHRGPGDGPEENAIWDEYIQVREAILASQPMNIETVVAKAKVAQREALTSDAEDEGVKHCLAVLADLRRIGGVL